MDQFRNSTFGNNVALSQCTHEMHFDQSNMSRTLASQNVIQFLNLKFAVLCNVIKLHIGIT